MQVPSRILEEARISDSASLRAELRPDPGAPALEIDLPELFRRVNR